MTKSSRIAVLAVLLGWAGRAAAAPSPDEIRAIARQGYLYAYPLVLMDTTRRGSTPLGENRFVHNAEFPDDRFRRVIRPNADTLYSSAWLDVSAEPVLLRVPDTHGRYYLMQLMDAWTETISVPGKRTTGTSEKWFAFVGPDWKGTLPASVQRIDCPTAMAWLLGRTQTNNPSDYGNVHAIQQGYVLMPLSRYPDGPQPARPRAGAEASVSNVPPPAQVRQMSPAEFFNLFTELLKRNPPHAGDGKIIESLARIGITAGRRFDASQLGPEGERAFEEGCREASDSLEKIVQQRPAGGPTGWSSVGGAVGRYGTSYAARAAVARIGLGANPPEDAVYLSAYQDSEHAPFSGSTNYVLHFDQAQLPPVRAFWSVTMYNGDGYFVKNPLNRFAIGDRDPLKYNADGSLDLLIQRDTPGRDRENNWLPAPDGAFNLMLRLYWPADAILKGQWVAPAVKRQ